jgi:ribosomal protein S18 acetylase RimI-like enzyme
MSLFIRKARRRDRHEMKACNERNLAENYTADDWDSLLTGHPGESAVLVDESHHVKGYILCDGETVISVAVDSEHRGQHWAHKLLTFYFANHPDVKTLQLHVRTTNEAAIHVYQKFGFVTTTKLPSYYTQPTEDGWLMVWKNEKTAD